MNRDDILKNIPKPSNRDVIVYDISLKDLIDEDVIQSYNKLYPVFIEKRKKYMELKERLAEYKNTLSSIYLFKPNWTEADYLQSLQNDKRTYATLYKEIKKTEDNINTLKRKVEGIDEKIKIQLAKEDKKIETTDKELEKEIEIQKDKLFNYKSCLEAFKFNLKDRIEGLTFKFDNIRGSLQSDENLSLREDLSISKILLSEILKGNWVLDLSAKEYFGLGYDIISVG